jgi:hypothetical protein
MSSVKMTMHVAAEHKQMVPSGAARLKSPWLPLTCKMAMLGVRGEGGCHCVLYHLHASCEPPGSSSFGAAFCSRWGRTTAGRKHARCAIALQLSQTHAAAGVGFARRSWMSTIAMRLLRQLGI